MRVCHGGSSSGAVSGCCKRLAPRVQHLAHRPRRPATAAATGSDEGVSQRTLNVAASNFAKGLEEGEDEDELVAQQLGVASAAQMSDVQGQYKDAIKRRLEERAEELRREKEARAAKFSAGKKAYERGQYPASVKLLELALEEEGAFTQLGGEIQLWLALAYQACGREEECLEVYRTVERTHTLPAMRRRAANLRYILEAPKLEISPDERVQIPLLTGLEANRGGRAAVSRPRAPPKTERKVPKTWDEEFWENYSPPAYLTNNYVWVAASVAATAAAVYSSYIQRGLLR